MVERIIVGYLNTNCYLYSRWKKACIIIDPGGDPDVIISHMRSKNLKPLGIVLTHGHLDHISALGAIIRHFTDLDIPLKIAAHQEDSHYFGFSAKQVHEENFSSMGPQGISLFEEMFRPVPDLDIVLKEGDTVFDSDLKVIHTPGHTPGGISLYSEESGMLFSGDTLFFEGVGRTDMSGGDHTALLSSIQDKLLALPDTTRVFPGHGPLTSIERERGYNPHIAVRG